MEMSDPQKVEILRRLKNYKDTCECQCLECGYKGPMGVISNGSKVKKVIAFIVAMLVFILFVPTTGFIAGSIAFAILLLIVQSLLKANVQTLYCPSCESILRTK